MAVFGPVELGCDIQMIGEAHRNDRIAARFFTEAEQKALAAGVDFYRIWARKESYIKCTGDGMACDLRSFDVVGDFTQVQEDDVRTGAIMYAVSEALNIHGAKTFFSEHTLPGYEMAVCYKNSGEIPVIWQEVEIK